MIVVAPLHELDAAIARWRPSHIVSLASPGAEAARLPQGVDILRLTFHDIAAPRADLTAARREDVESLLAFGRTWRGERPLLVHCWAGVSRSPAAAYAIACARADRGREDDLARTLREAAPFATPNPHFVRLADDLLDRRGAMATAIAGIGRGADAFSGTTFRLDLA